MNKNEIRERILARRNALPPAERSAKNTAVLQNLLSIPQVQNARTIMLYLDFRGEVETDGILRWGWQAGKRMAVPVTVKALRKLIPVELRPFAELQVGTYGIREPKGGTDSRLEGRLRADEVPVASIDVSIVPGLAFDGKGGRLGYGGGYYDRFLPSLRPDALKIGLAYEFQLVDSVPAEAHDIRMDLIVTESSVRNCKVST